MNNYQRVEKVVMFQNDGLVYHKAQGKILWKQSHPLSVNRIPGLVGCFAQLDHSCLIKYIIFSRHLQDTPLIVPDTYQNYHLFRILLSFLLMGSMHTKCNGQETRKMEKSTKKWVKNLLA